jgi:hypothetical protein
MLDHAGTYSKASSVVRELINEDKHAYEIVKRSTDLLLERVDLIDKQFATKLPIILAGDLANLYSPFFPQHRLIHVKNKANTLLLNYGIGLLQQLLS